jgi:signal peptidase II
MRMLARGLAISVAVVLLDQLSKGAVLFFFAKSPACVPRMPAAVTGFLNLVVTCNRGMSFGLLNNGAALNAVLLSLGAVAIVVVLGWWLSRVAHPFLAVAIGLVIGGAIGNVVDRLRFGAVVDFVDFHVGTWHWPAFNLADSAICLGVAAMLLDGLLLHREAH